MWNYYVGGAMMLGGAYAGYKAYGEYEDFGKPGPEQALSAAAIAKMREARAYSRSSARASYRMGMSKAKLAAGSMRGRVAQQNVQRGVAGTTEAGAQRRNVEEWLTGATDQQAAAVNQRLAAIDAAIWNDIGSIYAKQASMAMSREMTSELGKRDIISGVASSALNAGSAYAGYKTAPSSGVATDTPQNGYYQYQNQSQASNYQQSYQSPAGGQYGYYGPASQQYR